MSCPLFPSYLAIAIETDPVSPSSQFLIKSIDGLCLLYFYRDGRFSLSRRGSSLREDMPSPANLDLRRQVMLPLPQFFRGQLEIPGHREQHILRLHLSLRIQNSLELGGNGHPDTIGQFGVSGPEEYCSTLELVSLDRLRQ